MAPLSKREASRGLRCLACGSGKAKAARSTSLGHAAWRSAEALRASSSVKTVTGDARSDAREALDSPNDRSEAKRPEARPTLDPTTAPRPWGSSSNEEAAASVDPMIAPRVGGPGPRAAAPKNDPGHAEDRLEMDKNAAAELAAQRVAHAAARMPPCAQQRREQPAARAARRRRVARVRRPCTHDCARSQDARRPTPSPFDPKISPQ